MRATIRLLNGNILKEKKRYRWSGHTEGLYTGLSWKNFPCKVTKIKDGVISIYDYNLQDLDEIDATFKRKHL
jgi:hypothetical protein